MRKSKICDFNTTKRKKKDNGKKFHNDKREVGKEEKTCYLIQSKYSLVLDRHEQEHDFSDLGGAKIETKITKYKRKGGKTK